MHSVVYDGNGERIDSWLVKHFGYTRNFFHNIINRGGVCVNKQIIKKSYKLKNKDVVFVDNLVRFLSSGILQETPKIELDIVLEKEDYLVVYKPKGVLSHPNSVWDVSYPSVVGFLYHRYINLPNIGNFIRSGLIHRLDKDTDGLMILVKTEIGLSYFKNLFQQKSEKYTIQEKELVKIKKFYCANVKLTDMGKNFLSEIENDGYGINNAFYIKEIVKPKVPHSIHKEGITKILNWQVNKDNCSAKIFLEILTGRTHQIRYHLSNKGLPIIGDYLYGEKDALNLQLTAHKLEFLDNEGEYVFLEI